MNPKCPLQKRIHRRIVIMFFFFIIWFGVLIFRLFQIQVINHTALKEKALQQHQNIGVIYPKRGKIFDRSGNILACSIPSYSVFLTPFEGIPDEQQFQKIEKLKRPLGLSFRETQKIKSKIREDASFIWIKRKMDPEVSQKIHNLNLNGISLIEESKRFYPQKKLAAHVIGRVNIDEIGASGIEYKYNSLLEGEKGKRLILKDAKRREYRVEVIKEPESGSDLFLTLDETIQYIAARELEKAVKEAQADWGTAILSHPSSGEILAMANFPEFDLNTPPSQISLLDRNKAIHHIFDPGSTFKIITASAALESKKVNVRDTYDCRGGFRRIAKKTFRDHKKFDLLSFPEVIIHSSNIGATLISDQIGKKTLYETIKKFGFGEKTGIDLPAEEKGIVHPIDEWTLISSASLAIGYEICVTPIQMLHALNIIANHGVSVPLRIVKKIPGSPQEAPIYKARLQRVISEYTASLLSEILRRVVSEGTGISAQIKGYDVAGKTGTAQKVDPSTKEYTRSMHIASFAGFVPVENPVLSLIVIIDNPKGKYFGGDVAAPAFKKIASQVLYYLNIPPKKQKRQTLAAERLRREGKT